MSPQPSHTIASSTGNGNQRLGIWAPYGAWQTRLALSPFSYRRIRFSIPATLTVALCALLSACDGNPKPQGASATTTKPSDPILIGHIAPFTGDAAIWGNWERDGIDLAVGVINEKGGIKGCHLQVIHEDDQAKPTTAVSALRSLIDARGVKIVIGGSLSSTTLAMAPIAERNKVVLLSPSAQSPKISDAGDYIFRIFASSTIEGHHLARVIGKSGADTLSLLYLNNDYGVGLRDVLTSDLPALGVRLIAAEGYSADTSDFKSHIQKAVTTPGPKGVALLGYPSDMAHALKQMREMGLRPLLFAPNSFEADEIITIAGDSAEGVVYVYPVLPDAKQADDIKRRFKDKYGRPMNVYNGMGYDAISVLASAMENAIAESGAVDPTRVKDALYRLDRFPGITGPITFDKNGDVVERPMESRVVKGHVFKRLGDP